MDNQDMMTLREMRAVQDANIGGASEDNPEIEPQKPQIVVTTSTDAMRAEIEFIKVTNPALNPDQEDIEAALAEKGIVYGIHERYVRELAEDPIYRRKIEIAKGLPAKMGADGYLVYLIETQKRMRPKEHADGTVDYRDLGFIQNVAKDQVLCEVHHPEKGDDGCTIFGTALEGIYGRTPDLPVGKNTAYDEERSVVYSLADGNAEVTRTGVINVEDILHIRGNIDTSTGNISFVGDIIIYGDVGSGFKVNSKGDITVKGTVEGAIITAKGNIVINEGVHGMNRARITAGGNITSKYIQNAHLITGGDIFADSIMYCNIECNGSIELSGKRGVIIGGRSIIANALVAKAIGSESHTATIITMAGIGLKHNEKINLLKKEILALDTELISLVQTLTWCAEIVKKGGQLKPFQINALTQARVRNVEVRQEREDKAKELEDAQKELLYIDPSETYIKCSGRIYSGVKIVFGTQTMPIQNTLTNSRIYLLEGVITVSALF